MNQKYPPSILVALYTSVFIAVIYLLLQQVSGKTGGNLLIELLAIFTLSLLIITVILEFFLYRRLKSLNASNTREIERLKEMEAFRREFLGDVSHELKTPIFAIEGFVETLLDGALEDNKVNRKFLQKVGKHAGRLSSLVQDILVISQIESGDLGMNYERFSAFELVDELLDSLAYKFTKKGRDISYEVVANGLEKTLVVADRQRIEQVLRNLIDNAVKYGDANGVVKIILENVSGNKVLIKVQDNGPGIESQHLSRLFERFYRVDKSRSREKGGTGLGLAICKHLIEAHNEKLWLESELGQGATFMFTLSREEN
ncbi:MAG TPA: sensor histidine kinase [Bacteroidetes bacterium]|nr:sensor histidine kinase [Bacteroidota bacterium]